MISSQRQKRILELITEQDVVTIETLCRATQASRATIRRDLLEMDEGQMLRRTRGGAVSLPKSIVPELPVSTRKYIQQEEKARIAIAAQRKIRDDQVIYIGAGTTMRLLAAQLHQFHHLTVLTNDIGVAMEIIPTENNLIVAGGNLKKGSTTLTGIFTEQMLTELHVDQAFLSADAVDVTSGYMDYNTDEVRIKRMMITNARESFMLCDHTKFENKAFIRIVSLTQVSCAITGGEIRSEFADALGREGTELILA